MTSTTCERCSRRSPRRGQTESRPPISPIIDEVNDSRDEADSIRNVTGAVKWFLVVIARLLLTASLLLVGNTIRLSIYARRREVEVMRLVGATNWFIRWPFMVEGLACGFIGGAIAVGILFLGKATVVDPLADSINLISAWRHDRLRQARRPAAGWWRWASRRSAVA